MCYVCVWVRGDEKMWRGDVMLLLLLKLVKVTEIGEFVY